MAFVDFDDFVAKFANPRDRLTLTKLFNNYVSTNHIGRWAFSSWAMVPDGGSAPTTAAAPTSSTAGALFNANQLRNSSGSLKTHCVGGQMKSNLPMSLMVADRLSHQGGLSGTTITAQTTNLPTAALTRYTSGVGVFGALEGYAQTGGTVQTFSVSYTNSAGTAGQTSPLAAFGPDHPPGALAPIPLAAGDDGIRSVESVTLTGSTGTVGNFGVTLYKPLFCLDIDLLGQIFDPVLGGNMFGGFPEILDDACLMLISRVDLTANNRQLTGELLFAEV